MKLRYIIPFVFLLGTIKISGQVFDLKLSTDESNTQIHTARNSINLLSGYSYTPGGTGMSIDIVNPVVAGSISYNSQVDATARTLNTSNLVGTTSGGFNINGMGGSIYTIPIDVLPGSNGMTPSISLNYSSNSGPGVAGYGWQIGGISAISRVSRTIYNDGYSCGINLDANDRFAMDGQRLILTSGTYGASNSTYQTEIDGFNLIQAQLSSGTGPQNFLVKTKTGGRVLYGSNEDGRQYIDGFSEVLTWYANQIQDVFGNQVNYSYLSDNSQIYLGEITYGPNKITFYYKQRNDINTSYLKGSKIIQQLLLDKITISYNSNILKTYQLKYNQANDYYNNYSELNEVVEYGTSSTPLNSTVFNYQATSNVSMVQSTYNTSDSYVTYQSRIVTGDFNGDGKTDMLCLPDASKGATWSGMMVRFGDGNDNFGTGFSSSNSINLSSLDDIYALDLNGDGKDDVLYEVVNGSISTFYYMINNGNSFSSASSITTLPRNITSGLNGKDRRRNYKQERDNSLILTSNYKTTSADYDGDGVNDIFMNDNSGNYRIYSFANSSGVLGSTPTLRLSGTISTLTGQTISGDFNGDGRTDIWSIESGGIKIYTFNGSSLTLLYTSTWPTKDHYFMLGDFNGDGKADMFVYGYLTYDWTTWQLLLSNGVGFETQNINQLKANLKNDYIRSGDFNGDGCTDLMVTSLDQSWTGTYFYITQNKGQSFYSHSLPNYPIESHNYYLGDYNGDGRTDFICTDGLSPWWNGYQVYKSTGITSPLLVNVANGLNHLTTINYSKLSQATSDIYTIGSAIPTFPVSNFQGTIPVVSSVITDNGVGSTNTQSFYYEGAKIHRQGKGFLTYTKTIATDATVGTISTSYFNYNTSYFYPRQDSVTNKTTGGSAISSIVNSWAETVLDASNKRIFPYVQSSTQKNKLTGASLTTTTSYDTYGNPSPIVKSYSNNVSATTTISYTNNTTDWRLGRVDNSTVVYVKPGETNVTLTNRYTYNTDGIIKPDFVYFNEGTSLQYTEDYDYDSHGNVIQKLVSNQSQSVLSQTNYTYDSDGIRNLTVTDPLRRVSQNVYNALGQLKFSINYLNDTVKYLYDVLGRISSVSNPDGSQSSTSYFWTGTNKPILGVYGIMQSGNDGSVSISWYDKLQRSIRTEKKGFDGTMILLDNEFNSLGQSYRLSDPYFAGGSVIWAQTNGYDSYGRPGSVTRNTGLNTIYSYSGATITETTAGKAFSKTYSADGTLYSATDNGGSILYNYYADGKTKSIIAPGSIMTSMQYGDAARNQTQMIDPSAGTIGYTYDPLGRILTQTNARNQTTTTVYYPDGRINTVTNPEGVSTYGYYTNKQLSGVSSPNSINRTYVNDAHGRPQSITETIESVNYITSFTYDNLGRLKTKTHPSGIIETMNYNNNGYLASISIDGTTIYTVGAMNTRGQLTSAIYGSNLTSTFGYDSYGYPNLTQTGSIQDYRYSFDATTGNLSWRQNYKQNLTENFGYDNLDRLLGVTGPQNLTLTYKANGNIESKSDIGTAAFTYGNNTGPYALTSAPLSTGVIPFTSQTAIYSSFEKIMSIAEGNYTATFVYNSDNERAKMNITQSGSTILSRWYVGGSYMKETAASVTKEYTYIGGDSYNAPVVGVKQNGTTTWYYLLRDYLGNVTHQVNSSNVVVAEYSFDAWGRRRNPSNWNYDLSGQPELFAGRGFTGHEHLPWFNVINMNGRLYDPLVGRFFSPDNYVQAPNLTQNFNRYSYCVNNPLRYTDPSGQSFWDILLGSVFGAASWQSIINYKSGKYNLGQAIGMYFVNGASFIAGAGVANGVNASLATGGSFWAGFTGTSTVVSTGFSAGFVSGAAGGFTGGFITGFGSTAMKPGSDFSDMLSSGLNYGWKGAIFGGIAGGISGGIDAANHNRNFWTGAGKQNVVVKINPNGTDDLISESDFDQASKNTKELYKTQVQNGKNISISENSVIIETPDNINGITQIDGDQTIIATVSGYKNGTKIFTWGSLDKITIHAWRYQSNPFTSLRDLFYFRNL